MVLDTLLDPLLGWVLQLPLWLGIAILAFIITLIINFIYKLVTDQSEMKRLKDSIKSYQEKMKTLKDNPKKMMKVQGEAMQANAEYMKKSMKPTLFTFLPLIIIFAWMNAHLAFVGLDAMQPVNIDVELVAPARVTIEAAEGILVTGETTKDTIESQVSWEVAAPAGRHIINFTTADGESASTELIVGEMPGQKDKLQAQAKPFKRTTVNYEKSKPFGDFSIFGYMPGWLFTYILFSIVFSLATRKLMGIY